MITREEHFEYLIKTTTNNIDTRTYASYYAFYLHGYIFANQKECKNCKHSRNTNLKDEVSHGELFCTELVRFFSIDFGCNKWSDRK